MRPAIAPVNTQKESKIKNTPRTPQLASLLKGESKSATTASVAVEMAANEPYTEVQLREAWHAFAEQRRKFQAEYQMLTQHYEVRDNTIIVQLLSPVHETMLNGIKVELTSFLRDKLRNNAIQVAGAVQEGENKKVIYTNREKFDFLAEKNPMLKELKDRLGLDTDF